MKFLPPEKYRGRGQFELSTTPGDFSEAAWYLVAGILDPNGDLQLKAVAVHPHRTALLKYLILMGAPLRMDNHRWIGSDPVADIHCAPPKKIFPVRILDSDLPALLAELFPLGLALAYADGVSDLPACSQTEPLLALFNCLEVPVERTQGQFKIQGPTPLQHQPLAKIFAKVQHCLKEGEHG